MNTLDAISDAIIPVLRRHGVTKAGFFGSIVREELTENSDVDLLVELDDTASLLDLISLKLTLEEQLGRPVDLVEYSQVKPSILKEVLRSEIRIV